MFNFSDLIAKQLRAFEGSRLLFLETAIDSASISNSISKSVSLIADRLADVGASLSLSITEAFDGMQPWLAKASGIMFRNGWWIVHCLPLTFYREIVEQEDAVTPQELTRVVLEYLNRNRGQRIAEVVKHWEVNAFQQRAAIFQDALWAHKRKKYTLTVPVLVFQVEGIIREFIKTSDNNFTAWRFETVRKKFKEKFDRLSSIPEGRKITYDDVSAIENYYNLEMLERLYSDYDPRDHADPDDVNRNAIGHGLWMNYATIESSTRLFLFLDMLHSMLRQLEHRD